MRRTVQVAVKKVLVVSFLGRAEEVNLESLTASPLERNSFKACVHEVSTVYQQGRSTKDVA